MNTLRGPGDVLAFWIGDATTSAEAAAARAGLWFQASETTDANIRARFAGLPDALAGGLSKNWALAEARGRLAAIIALDQFPRNMFRGTARAFDYDEPARLLVRGGIETGADQGLREIERQFFYMPLMHGETMDDQKLSTELFERLFREARPAFRNACETALREARRHKAIIAQFGRFPSRNAALGRASSDEEIAFLARQDGTT